MKNAKKNQNKLRANTPAAKFATLLDPTRFPASSGPKKKAAGTIKKAKPTAKTWGEKMMASSGRSISRVAARRPSVASPSHKAAKALSASEETYPSSKISDHVAAE